MTAWTSTTPDEIRAWRDQLTRSGHVHKALLLSAALERIEALEANQGELKATLVLAGKDFRGILGVIKEHLPEVADRLHKEFESSSTYCIEIADAPDAAVYARQEHSKDYARAESAEASLANALRVGDQMAESVAPASSLYPWLMCPRCRMKQTKDEHDHERSCPVALWRAMPRAG